MRSSPSRSGASAILVVLLLSGCSGDDDDSSDFTPRKSTIPPTLRGFLMARGVPLIYSIAFADQTLDDKGVAQQAASTRRVEAWTWIGANSTRAVFDSGFLVEEKAISTSLTSVTPPRSPTDFNGGMTPDEIAKLVGTGYTDETGKLGKATLMVRRYKEDTNRPPQAYGFVDGRLASVVVGVAMEVN